MIHTVDNQHGCAKLSHHKVKRILSVKSLFSLPFYYPSGGIEMLSVKIDEEHLIAILEPKGALSERDFQSAATMIDPLIEKHGQLNGIIIHTKSFPGWESFAALYSHLRFVKNHHQKLSRVALVTDSVLGDFAENIASHFIKADIQLFSYQEYEQATNWVIGDI